MIVNVLRITLHTEQSKVTLNKSIAKQFPIHWDGRRSDLSWNCKPQPVAICKVQARTLGGSRAVGWLVLAESHISGLAWYRPVCGDQRLEQDLLNRGSWVDVLTEIPTAIL